MLTVTYVLLSMASGVAFYASTKHQTFAPVLHQKHATTCLLVACVCWCLATLCAVNVLGTWPGIYAALTTLMLVCVVLPYLSAWNDDGLKHSNQRAKPKRGKNKHVG